MNQQQVFNTSFLSSYTNKQGKLIPDLLLRSEPSPNEMVSIIEEFTNTYKNFSPDDIELREAACIAIQLKGIIRPIQEQDLFAGRMIQMPIGFTPQSKGTGLGYCIHPDIDQMLLNKPELSDKNNGKLEELLSFWQQEGTVQKSRKKMPEEVKQIIPSELYFLESGIAFQLYRMSGVQLDYYKLIKLGISGLLEEIATNKSNYLPDSKEFKLYLGMESVLHSFSELCLFYAAQSNELAVREANADRATELAEMSKVLENISENKPTTFREGLQLVYLYNRFDGAKNYGRMDNYLADLYNEDHKNGRIDEEEAVRLLSGIWRLMIFRDNRYDTRLIIGGLGRYDEEKADEVAMLILETSNRIADIVPQVALRFHKKQNFKLYQKGLNVLASGNTFPMLYNDEVNIPAVQKAFNIPYQEAIHAIQFGCGEYVINHRSVGTPSGVINLLQALLVTINRGIDPTTGKPMGMPLDQYLKYRDFETFEDLFNAYKEQVSYHVGPLALQEYLEYTHAAEDNSYLTTSILMNDCIKRGKAVFDGGIRYMGGTLETYGNTNTADSLTAIRELVYKKKEFTLDELRKMLVADFKGFEIERRKLLDCSKYGNDNDVADEMMLEVHNHICKVTSEQAALIGLHSYLVVVINNDANTVLGTFTSASPDGRKVATYLCPGNNPVGGADKNGVTAFLNSLAKLDPTIHAGSVQNMKFSKEVVTKHRKMFEVLIDTYFENGGTQAMLTVINKGDLEEAIKYPSKYQNLIVRVGGFSERFVNLPPETQREILSRTLN